MEMFWVDLAVKSTIVLAGAFGVMCGMRRSSAAARHWVWVLAFGALLVLPVLAAVLPAWRILPSWSVQPKAVAVENAAVQTSSPRLPVVQAVRADVRGLTESTSPDAPERSTTKSVVAAPTSSSALSIPNIFRVYAFGIAISLLPLLAGTLALLRLERKSLRLNQPPWPALLATLSARVGVRRTVLLLESPSATTMPMTWGIGRSRILLPSTARDWSADRRRLVLLHELAHAKRRDAVAQFLARLVCALYWFHPLAWLALRQLRVEAEIACDDLVLAADTKPSVYATELLDIVSVHRGLSFLSPAVAMARGNHPQIHSRIRAILDHARNRKAMSATVLLCVMFGLTLVLLPLAALRAQEAPDEFSHVVHFDLGNSQFLPGDNISITEIRGTADTVTPGNTYQIKGTYKLASAEEAKLATYVTEPADDTHHDPYDQRQTVAIKKGSGTFTVMLPFISKGWPHLSFYPARGGSSFSTLYFGSAESLLKKSSPMTIIDRVGQTKASRPSVLVLVSPNGIFFEGNATTWEALPALLEKVSDRPGTILAFALTSDQMTVAKYHEAFAHVSELAAKFHFRYVSDTGIKAAEGAPAGTQPAAGFDPYGKTIIVVHNGKVQMQFQDGKILFEADKFIRDGNSIVGEGGVVVTKPGAKFATVPTTMPSVP